MSVVALSIKNYEPVTYISHLTAQLINCDTGNAIVNKDLLALAFQSITLYDSYGANMFLVIDIP